MTYLDYSATTPIDERILTRLVETTTTFFGNPNSQHALGKQSYHLIDEASELIKYSFECPNHRVIYTSGATEANNLAILGLARKYPQKKHVITSFYEHPSVTACMGHLQEQGYCIDFISVDENGHLKLDELQHALREDTLLVSIGAVMSELGFCQNLDKIAQIVHQQPQCFFHSDITQMVGKVQQNLHQVDLLTYTAHKIYGPIGVGACLVKEDIHLKKNLLGGHSYNEERSFTPAVALIDSLAYATQLAIKEQEVRKKQVLLLSTWLRETCQSIPKITIHSPVQAIPHIITLSIHNLHSSDVQQHLSQHEIYVSTQTACQKNASISQAVYRFTNSLQFAKGSIRISISHKTTQQELINFIEVIRRIL